MPIPNQIALILIIDSMTYVEAVDVAVEVAVEVLFVVVDVAEVAVEGEEALSVHVEEAAVYPETADQGRIAGMIRMLQSAPKWNAFDVAKSAITKVIAMRGTTKMASLWGIKQIQNQTEERVHKPVA